MKAGEPIPKEHLRGRYVYVDAEVDSPFVREKIQHLGMDVVDARSAAEVALVVSNPTPALPSHWAFPQRSVHY